MALRPPFERYATTALLTLTHPPDFLSDWVFIPCGNYIRAIDFRRNLSIVFHKQGRDISRTLDDAKIRQQFPFLHAPAIHRINAEQGWYEEERITGIPLSRMANGPDKTAHLQKLIANLGMLYAETRQDVTIESYVDTLTGNLDLLLSNAGAQLAPDVIAQIRTLIAHAAARLARYRKGTVTLVQSRGDFGLGNLIAGSGKSWIIDREYTACRSILFDCLFLSVKTRGTTGLANCLIAARNGTWTTDIWPLPRQGDMEPAVSLFCLELISRLAINPATRNLAPWLSEMTGTARP